MILRHCAQAEQSTAQHLRQNFHLVNLLNSILKFEPQLLRNDRKDAPSDLHDLAPLRPGRAKHRTALAPEFSSGQPPEFNFEIRAPTTEKRPERRPLQVRPAYAKFGALPSRSQQTMRNASGTIQLRPRYAQGRIALQPGIRRPQTTPAGIGIRPRGAPQRGR